MKGYIFAGQAVAVATLSLLPHNTGAEERAAAISLEEITVTAQKRSESLQKVPLSVVALTGDALNKSGTTNTFDLQLKTPGFVVTTNGPFGQPYIRGIGTDILGAGSDPSVAVNIDGVYVPRPTAAIRNFFDIERVEVVKGPQGTLYGRNATAGAINIITRKPEQQFSAGADLTLGNYGKVLATGFLNVPLGEKSAVRVSGIRSSHDGYTDIISLDANNPRHYSLDDEDVYGGRLEYLIQPDDRLTVSFGADYSKEDDARFLNNRPNPAFASITPALILGAVLPGDVHKSTSDRNSFVEIEDWGLRSTVGYASDTLEFKSITAFRRNEFADDEDIDGTNLNIAWLTEWGLSKSFTQEFQLSSSSSTFNWIVGAFYLHENASSRYNVRLGGDGEPLFALGLTNPADSFSVAVANAKNKTNAYAVFGQGSYYLSDQISLTVGGRYSWEKKDFTLNDELALTQLNDNESWGSFTPKVGLEYYFSDENMLYISATRGFKSGGYNADGIGEQFDPEKIWSYEAGMKATWMDSRIRTNLSGFYYDYTDLQVRVRDPLGTNAIVANVGSAKIYGLEVQTDSIITEEFSVSLNASYLKTKVADNVFVYDSFTDDEQDVSGNRLPRAPKWNIGASATYSVPISTGQITVVGEYRYQSGIYFDIFDRDLAQQGGYSLVNARIRYDNSENDWYVQIWGKNLTDKEYRASALYNGLGGSLEFYAPPRTYGVQMGASF